MNLVDRVKNILLTPKTEWDVIAAESTPTASLITGYVLPLAGVSAVAHFIGLSLVGSSMGFFGGTFRMPLALGIGLAVWHLVAAVIAVFVVGFIVDALAPTFGAQKSSSQALKVAVYSYTPGWVAGILMILPMLGILVLLAALYGIYLMYLGLPRLMKNPEDKSIGYTAVTIIAAIVVGVIVSAVGTLVAGSAMMATGAVGMGSTVARSPRVDPSSPMGTFAKKMEEAGKKMEAAEKSGDPSKQMEAAMGAFGTAISGGKAVEPLQLEQIKAYVPETFAGLPRTGASSERAGAAGFMTAKAAGTYSDAAGKRVDLEVVDTGGVAGLMGLATWAGVMSERETDDRMERTRKEGDRVVHEEVSKRGGTNKYSLVLANRFMVSASGHGVDINTLKSGVSSLDLGKLESTK